MQQKTMLAAVIAVIALLALGGLLGRSCTERGGEIVVVGIDAGPGDHVIDDRLDATIRADELEIRALEDRNERALDAFNAEQAAEYAEVRSHGRHAVAAWLSDFNTALKTDAGVPAP